MLDPAEMIFKRRFSVNPYKNLRMPLGRMDCHKDWVNDTRGDPYPVIESNETEGASLTESLPRSRWKVENNTGSTLYKARLLGGLTPCATYEITFDQILPEDTSRAGIFLNIAPETLKTRQIVAVSNVGGKVCLSWQTVVNGEVTAEKSETTDKDFESGMGLMVSIHGHGFFNCYLSYGDHIERLANAVIPELKEIDRYSVFMNSTVSAYVELAPGAGFLGEAEFYMDAGGSQADMKSVRYENGLPVIEDGRIFMTMSVREERGGYQAVISWKPGTSEFRMEGCYFFDLGDDRWCGDIASTLVYDRNAKLWYVWACAFSHGHILCHAVSRSDLRYGVNVVDAEFMPRETNADGSFLMKNGSYTTSDDASFFAKQGDEDPDLMFDDSIGKWRLIICRLVTENGSTNYRYFSYVSDDPFTGFEYRDKTTSGSATGGSIITVEGKRYLLCGSDFNLRAQYRVHPIDDLNSFRLLRFDYDDGGFRGWGTLLPIPCGTRTRYYLMTFDRHNFSTVNNWSYGNIYVFEADRMTRPE